MEPTDRIAGFTWPLPRAFSAAVSACRFEQGDVLYDDPAAYGGWPLTSGPGAIIQVLDPPKSARALSGDAEGNRFRVSWDSPVILDLYRDGADRPERHTTSQGRLFTCLWHGDLSRLDAATPFPEAPVTLRELQRRLPEVEPAFRRHFRAASDAGGHSLLLVAVDDASESSRVKAHAIESLLSDAFAVEAYSLTAAETGLDVADALHPALFVRGLAIGSVDAQAIEQRLARLLYAGGDREATRFSLARHAHLVAFDPPEEDAAD